MDHYENQRLRDIIENYVETIERYTIDIGFCSQCEFAENDDDLTEVDEGDLNLCQPCLESFLTKAEVDSCAECEEYHTTGVLDGKNGEVYCYRCIDGIDTESEEEESI